MSGNPTEEQLLHQLIQMIADDCRQEFKRRVAPYEKRLMQLETLKSPRVVLLDEYFHMIKDHI